MESRNRKTIYISNLPQTVNEEDLKSIFENFGSCVSCELNMENYSAYFEFANEMSADKALAMDNVEMGSNQVRVVIAFQDSNFPEDPAPYTLASDKIDYTKAVQIFVGDMGFDVDETMLKDGFSQFGKILDAKVVRMPDGKHRGYAFISFTNESEAENAIQSMNNTMFHNRNIKCNWATKNKNSNGGGAGGQNRKQPFQQHQQSIKTLEEISYKTPQSNTSVYVTGDNLLEEVLRPCFERFGKIKNIKAYPEKNHAFVNFESHDAAAYAIFQLNGYNINNTTMKCNWSKKNTGMGMGTEKRLMDNFYGNSHQQQQYYEQSPVQQQFNNGSHQMQQHQYEQFYQANYHAFQQQQSQQQQFYNNSQLQLDYFNGIQQQQQQQQQNYNQQYQNSFNARPQKTINPQSYPFYAAAYNNNPQQQYNMYQQQ